MVTCQRLMPIFDIETKGFHYCQSFSTPTSVAYVGTYYMTLPTTLSARALHSLSSQVQTAEV
jgi:hypothetical protein